MTRSLRKVFLTFVFVLLIPFPAFALDAALADTLDGVLERGVEESHWQETADEIHMWLKTKKTDFIVVDVRPNAKAYAAGHIPGAIHIPYNEILISANLKALPKDKKIILVCSNGQLANLPVVPLRALGYDAYTMMFGYSAWAKGFGGGEQMKGIVERANLRNYPMEK